MEAKEALLVAYRVQAEKHIKEKVYEIIKTAAEKGQCSTSVSVWLGVDLDGNKDRQVLNTIMMNLQIEGFTVLNDNPESKTKKYTRISSIPPDVNVCRSYLIDWERDANFYTDQNKDSDND